MLTIGLSLTLALVIAVMRIRWTYRRCEQHGHAWTPTDTGMRCARCKHQLDVGDRM